MRHILCAIFLGLVFSAQAQPKAEFHSQNYVGLLEGEAGPFMQLQSINGFQLRNWFAGVGTGLDYYMFRSVPLFLSFNKSLCSCERSLFFSFDGGYNFVWDSNTGNFINSGREGTFRPAVYWAAGVGYRLMINKNRDAILMNLGYSAKHIREEVKGTMWCVQWPCPETAEQFRYRLNRISLRVGWQF